MRSFFETIIVAFSMFSAFPMPRIEWNKDNMRYSLLAFPLIGAVIGCLEALWGVIAVRVSFPDILTAAGCTVIPILATGGIHLDGYMDVSDALSSYSDTEKKKMILSDPHIGAFAVIRTAVYLLFYFGLVSLLKIRAADLFLFGSSFVFSRCLSGLAVCVLPISESSSLAKSFRGAAEKGRAASVLRGMCGACVLIMAGSGFIAWGWKTGVSALVMILCGAGQWFYLKRTAAAQFGGLSGDLNGWFLQKAELWMMAALVLCSHFL